MEGQMDGHTDIMPNRWKDRQMDIQTLCPTDGRTDGWTSRHNVQQMEGQTDGHTDIMPNRWKDRWINRQTDEKMN
jgi:hypothetical protein